MSMEMYNSVCKHEFVDIKTDIGTMRDDVAAIKSRVYNGYGKSIVDIEKKVDELEQQITRRMNTVETRLWGVFIGIFMILLAQLVPQFLPVRVAENPVAVVRAE